MRNRKFIVNCYMVVVTLVIDEGKIDAVVVGLELLFLV